MFCYRKGEKFFKDEVRYFMTNNKSREIIYMIGDTHPSDLRDSTGITLLHLAARCNNTKMINYLINRLRIKVDVKDSSGMTPLKIAVHLENYEAAESLIDANAKVLLTDIYGECALEVVLRRNNYLDAKTEMFLKKAKADVSSNEELVERLLSFRCSLTQIMFLKEVDVTRIYWIKKYSTIDPIDLMDSILAAMALIHWPNLEFLLHQNTVIHRYNTNMQINIFDLLDMAINTNKIVKRQILIYKCSRISELLKVLTNKIIELDLLKLCAIENELEVLNKIFRKSSSEILELLLKTNIVQYVKNKLGYDLRMNIFANPQSGTLELMQNTDYDVNSRNYLQQTALHLAVDANIPKNVKKLLDMGANPNALDCHGKTPAFYVCSATEPTMKRDCLEFLFRGGVNLQICDIEGKTFVEQSFLKNRNSISLEPAISKLAILKVMGVPIKQSVLDCINLNSKWKTCYETHRRNLEAMNKKMIYGSLTLLTALSQKPDKIARVVGAQIEEIREILKDPDCLSKENFYYYPMLNRNINEALKICQLKDKVRATIEVNFGELKGYHLVIDKIIEYLSYKDLLMFE